MDRAVTSSDDAVSPDDRELTVPEAARWLRVSPHYLGDLLAVGAFPCRTDGARRYIRVGDLRDFKARQRVALDEITGIGEELGYDEGSEGAAAKLKRG